MRLTSFLIVHPIIIVVTVIAIINRSAASATWTCCRDAGDSESLSHAVTVAEHRSNEQILADTPTHHHNGTASTGPRSPISRR